MQNLLRYYSKWFIYLLKISLNVCNRMDTSTKWLEMLLYEFCNSVFEYCVRGCFQQYFDVIIDLCSLLELFSILYHWRVSSPNLFHGFIVLSYCWCAITKKYRLVNKCFILWFSSTQGNGVQLRWLLQDSNPIQYASYMKDAITFHFDKN